MASVFRSNSTFSVRAHIGDAKTLLAFNMDKTKSKDLAGFTIFCQPSSGDGYYLLNTLKFENPADHAQDATVPANASLNAPFHKFRWVHVPGSFHQGAKPVYGAYTYTVTPRYFNAKHELQPLDKSLSLAVPVNVGPFAKGSLKLGFTRGFTQSEAFVHNFGKNTPLAPKDRTLTFETSQIAGTNSKGVQFSYADEYDWMGYTARHQIFDILNTVLDDKSLHLDVLAYDLNEPDLMAALLKLAAQGRIRVVLDNAALHVTPKKTKAKPKSKTAAKKKKKPKGPTWEDQFTKAFQKAQKGGAAILRGHFSRYAHDKIFVVSQAGKAQLVMTGSTNFSVTGMYVNSNHVLVFDDPVVTGTYYKLFQEIWTDKASGPGFIASSFAGKSFQFQPAGVAATEITFSPHSKAYALQVLQGVASRVKEESTRKGGSVLFAVMQLDGSDSTVYKALAGINKDKSVFSYGISDTTSGIALYKPGSGGGVLVTGKPASTVLPPPFDQVPNIGAGHQVHHKFVVCGFNGPSPVVYCGSSNLASGGEQQNGDNLLAIHDGDVATAFAIEAVALVDHFDFLDKRATKKAAAKKGSKKATAKEKKPASKSQAAAQAEWFLGTSDTWAKSYFDTKDLHCADRLLFG